MSHAMVVVVVAVVGVVAGGTYLVLSRSARSRRPAEPMTMVDENEVPGRIDTFFDSDDRAGVATFTREELFTVGTAHTQLDLDPRRKAAVLQQFDIKMGQRQLWRKSSRGQFLEIADGREVLVLNHLVSRPTAERALKALVAQRAAVEQALGAKVSQVDLLWPREIVVGFDGGIEGYIAPVLDPDFLATGKGSKLIVRTLNLSGGSRGKKGPVDAPVSLELVRLVATWLRALHGANVIHGGLDLTSLAFAEGPTRIAALDYSNARVLGHGPWSDTSLDSSLDKDRKAMARIAFALLVPDATMMANWLSASKNVPGLVKDQRLTERLRWLWARSTGNAGSMPTVEEWAAALAQVEPSVDSGLADSRPRRR